MRWTPILATCLLVVALNLNGDGHYGVEAGRGMRLCGTRLTKMLVKICRGKLCGGYATIATKRGVDVDRGWANEEVITAGVNDAIRKNQSSSAVRFKTQMEADLLASDHSDDAVNKDELMVELEKWKHRSQSNNQNKPKFFDRVVNRKRKRGVADQCCENRCSFTYLKSFCC